MSRAVFIVITVSDSCFNKSAKDTSGPCLKRLVQEIFPSSEIFDEIVPDNQEIITQALCKYADNHKAQAIFTTGGTGFSPRDVTPEATRTVIHRECPQLALAMSLESFKKTPFAALSRAVCGIRNQTLIVNFPGSLKAVRECFEAIKIVLPHAIQLICDDIVLVSKTHQELQSVHVCPHKTGTGGQDDRNSPFPMLPIRSALDCIFQIVQSSPVNADFLRSFESPVDIPPFRASIKDGYAVKSTGFSGVRRVIGCIAAGDDFFFTVTTGGKTTVEMYLLLLGPHQNDLIAFDCKSPGAISSWTAPYKVSGYTLEDDECYKINTGAPMPEDADCVIQVEDTKLLKTTKDGTEELVEILVEPQSLMDIRPIGCDLSKGSKLFPAVDVSEVVVKSILSSVGRIKDLQKPKIVVISTGSELLDPFICSDSPSKIYDSNTTMLVELLKYFGFECIKRIVVKDDLISVKNTISDMLQLADFIICTGGVSMGDKDFIKPALNELEFKIHFGRVNMKPGKPMTFASNKNKFFFGLPGNPVSAFVTFHLFVLPTLRWASGWERNKCELATIQVKLENDQLLLDPRPEFVRASIISRNSELFAKANGNQMSSRLQSIVGADVLLHLPERTENRKSVGSGESFTASVLRYDFISKYE